MTDLTGMRFGRLVVIEFAYVKITPCSRKAMWRCKCDCGNEKIIRGSSLTGGISKSCGCLAKEVASKKQTKHSGFGTRLYNVWDSMRQRCNNPKNKAYHNYGGRGVKICEEWNDYLKFKEWAYANGYDEMAEKGVCTLDRINNDGPYSPDNCRWCSMKQQSRNKRDTIIIDYQGETHSLKEWAEITGIQYATLWRRYSNGSSPEEILTTKKAKK